MVNRDLAQINGVTDDYTVAFFKKYSEVPMRSIFRVLSIALLANLAGQVHAQNSSSGSLKLGVAYDLGGIGFTGQYQGVSLFLSGNAIAIDKRIQNFYSDNRRVHIYVDAGGFYQEHGNDRDTTDSDDTVGLRAPIGLTFGLTRNTQAFVQITPSIGFANGDTDFSLKGGLGIRFKL